MNQSSVPLSVAARIVAAHFGPRYYCCTVGYTCSTRCRIAVDYYDGYVVERTEYIAEGSNWYEVLSKVIPYFRAEYDPNGKTILSDYCGRLMERRKAKENSHRHSEGDI